MAGNNKDRDKLIMKYGPLVKSIVGRMSVKLPIDAADREDLYNVGIIGLMEALDKFDENRNVQFETYARFRIKGAILDELRSRDWVPRSIRHKDSKLEEAFANMKKTLGRRPEEEEVANYLGITLEQYYKLLDDTKGIPLISQEDLTPEYLETHSSAEVMESVNRGTPFDLFAGEELRNQLKKLIDDLPGKEKVVMSLYYSDEMTMKEIGRILDLTESRVCQLHTQAIVRLRSALKDSWR
ncbi:MAG: FliA/WhiG family RNA polymerase sigma factor [Deltaproteobacteria bacterium]|nr:FliA/WhiG family RNA polymerase sigma factor [Deltaproteobacteria bacterium]